MYDRVATLEGIPQSSGGEPEPVIIANEHRVVLAYRVCSQRRYGRVSPALGSHQEQKQ